MPHPAAIILSVEGTELSSDERRLFASTNPLGFILFQRNCESPEQIIALNHDLRDCVGWECPILIDQEGGRVQRLKPPHWKQYMTAQSCHTSEDVECVVSHIANDLAALNIDVNCAPVMDVLCEGTHDVIGDRAFSDNPQEVFDKTVVACATYLKAGITPFAKHIPGHGRATSDSHLELPVVDTPLSELEQTDFEPFRRLARHSMAPQIWGMVAHVIYEALDSDNPASVSKDVMRYIRDEMGIDQFLIADDISMKALDKVGNLGDRAVKTLEAGCDATLYCAGILTEMKEIMAVIPAMTEKAYDRYDRSRVSRRSAA
jgi:beta-N-acetylhexosaminidase